MKLELLCQERQIRRIKWATPLLVPSFSSRGFTQLKVMHEQLREHTTDASLVSAYDLHHGHLDETDIYGSEILFIDSGGFEVGTSSDLSDIYNFQARSKPDWSQRDHEEVIQKLQPLTPLVVVNYDARGPITEQIGSAVTFFNKLPRQYASDFLVKPTTSDAEYVNSKDLAKDCEAFAEFDVLGITEKELGSSFLSRCKSLISLRHALQGVTSDLPIHVFGALDPLSVMAYFLCGADIFDGLSWLRLAYRNSLALYYNSYALTEGLWNRPNHSVHVRACLQNLEHLSRTQAIMARFARSHDWRVLELEDVHLRQLQSLIGAAGVEF